MPMDLDMAIFHKLSIFVNFHQSLKSDHLQWLIVFPKKELAGIHKMDVGSLLNKLLMVRETGDGGVDCVQSMNLLILKPSVASGTEICKKIMIWKN